MREIRGFTTAAIPGRYRGRACTEGPEPCRCLHASPGVEELSLDVTPRAG